MDGWEEVADYALNWALEHAKSGPSQAMPATQASAVEEAPKIS
jgi:hypothetical protein